MTREELKAWIKRHGLRQVDAADALGMSVKGLEKNLYGYTKIGRQTAIICDLLDQLESCIRRAAEKKSLIGLLDH